MNAGALGTLAELANGVGGKVVGDASVTVTSVSAVEDAVAGCLTFAVEERYLEAALKSRAAAVLVDASIAPPSAPKPLIVVENARRALSRLLGAMRPQRPAGPYRDATAIVAPDAELAGDVFVGAHAYIGRRARIGSGAIVGAGAYVGDDAVVGAGSWLHPHAAVLHRCVIGERVVLHAGSVIGSEGFGWAFTEGRLERIPQVGNVVLEDDVEIGANTCVDRAQTGSTRIGTGTKIDNLVQIGHNCRIGKHCAIASQTGLAGSTVIGDYCKIAGQVGFKGHITVGSGVTIAGQSGVWGDVPDGMTISGNPARDHREDLRREVMIRKLPKLIARVEALERDRRG
jgi:UDP-3-O-[3-hydroxymyristoyl] glucosamine N-acyltransferase